MPEDKVPGTGHSVGDLVAPPLDPFKGPPPVTNDAQVEKLRRETPEEALRRVEKESGFNVL